jgi:pimeloyl-ACP methyl ester carboxylesterase
MNAFDFPPEFRTSDIATNGTSIHVRSGGVGPAVVLLHGYGETGGRRWRSILCGIIP